MRNPILLVWKWTTSRGINTAGWNICTLYADGEKVASTCGGNYDMKGTVLGDFLQNTHHDRLLKLHRRAGSRFSISPTGEYKRLKTKKAHRWSNHGEFYGLTAYYKRGETKPFKMSLDGGTGTESMWKIARKIGLSRKYHGETKSTTTYTLTDKKLLV